MLSWDEFHHEEKPTPVGKATIDQPLVKDEVHPSELNKSDIGPEAEPAGYKEVLDAADEQNNANALQ
ncbi:MAG: hypothetical protein VX605_02570, partial [Pseudomonadota bacterium]|nr:hypothetical protein [Pseudomonadota bacterium]